MRPRPGPLAVILTTLALVTAAAPAAGRDGEQVVPSIELRGALTPAAADWAGHALEQADADGAPFAIIRLDTPGGLDSAVEDIVDRVRTAPLPVVVYVDPGGAGAGVRGAAIVDAADVAAMAPGTTLELDGNDLGENTALKQGRIDMIAADQATLLEKLHGYRVGGPKSATLSTAGSTIDERGPTLPYRLLSLLVEPDVVYLLLLVGLLGLALESFLPGAIVPGAIGAVALVLGVLGALQLPVTAIGVVLLAAGAALIAATKRFPTGGLLGAAGVAALIAAGLLLFDTGTDAVAVTPAYVIAAGLVLGLTTVAIGTRSAARGRPLRRPLAGSGRDRV
jgi:membrane-bound serine protease (ClpP class)